MKSIGFYGDSFCADLENDHSKTNNYDTYIKMLSKDATIVNLGLGGSSVWDNILLQFQEDNLPEVCIFVWTEPDRLFHRKHRNLNWFSINNDNFKDSEPLLHSAVLKYYSQLHDFEKHKIECSALLYYFDNVVLSKYKNTKFIHMWSFKDSIYHRWSNGVEIRPALIELSVKDSDDLPRRDRRANHIEGQEKNSLLYNVIKDAIENYENGRLINYD